MLVLLLACGPAALPPAPDPAPPAAPLVLLISVDTARADAFGAFGSPDGRTPVVDALAARGLSFTSAWTHAPTTLSAHSSAMTGLDPHGHGVVRNGFPLRAELPVLAERFEQAGWDRIAVVGSAALEEGMGLGRGFRAYEDHDWRYHLHQYEVSAEVVNARALELIDARPAPEQPLLLFVHYYDVHMPWDSAPPELQATFTDPDYSGSVGGSAPRIVLHSTRLTAGEASPEDIRQARGLYLAEVSWVDQNIGRLLEGLAQRNLLQDSLVVLFADHGEVLHEIPARPYRHGPDVDSWATHIPLVFAGQGRYATEHRAMAEPARLMDLGSTVLGMVGLGGTLGEGRDLRQIPDSVPVPPVFLEANWPHEQTSTSGWPNLPLERGVVQGGQLLTRAPYRGEGPALVQLPDQQPVEDPARQAELSALLDAWDGRAPGAEARTMDEETRERLRALGYQE